MKSIILQIVPFSLAVAFIAYANYSQWCVSVARICNGSVIDEMIPYFTYPLYFFSLYFLPAAIVLIFVRRDIFTSWLRFAKYAFFFAFIFIAGTHVTSGAYMDFAPFYRDDAARVAGGVLATLTLLLVAWKYLKRRK